MFLRRLDWVLFGAIAFLGLCSSVTLFSIAKPLFYQQLAWYGLGAACVIVLVRFDWRPLVNYHGAILALYGFSLLLLIATLFAPPIRGIRGWLVLGPLQFQTSEFAKLVLIIVFSWFWAKAHVRIAHLRNLFVSMFYVSLPGALILIQPDMGSALILFGIWFGYLLISGIQWKHLGTAGALFVITGIFLWTSFLAPYQKNRILGLFYPERDPLGVNYNVIQSKIAIGSAGFFGKGFGQGSQVQLGFLPEAQTDFIFSAFMEEWGMLGGALAIGAFVLMLFRIVRAGMESGNNFSRMFCLGAAMMCLLHFILNIGSALGLLPVIGVPFPFLSYGGSHLLTNLAMAGIIQGIVVRSKF